MLNKTTKPDHLRRRVIQGTVLSTAAIAMPGLVSAACGAGDHKVAQISESFDSNNSLTNDDVRIELVESKLTLKGGSLARVTISNTSDRAIKLSHLSPGAVTTQQGVYQLNALLVDNPISVRPDGVYQFWLRPDDGTQALRSRKPVPSESDNRTSLKVVVVSATPSGTTSRTQRVEALI